MVKVTLDEEGRSVAYRTLATTQHEVLAFVPTNGLTTDRTDDSIGDIVDQLGGELAADSSLALAFQHDPQHDVVVAPDRKLGTPGLAEQARQVRRLVERLRGAGGPATTSAPIVVLRVSAVRAAGGFDPSFPGLGWPDLVQRLRQQGEEISGVANGLPFVDRLHDGLDVAQQCRSEGLWLIRHRPAPAEPWSARHLAGSAGASSVADYRRALLIACRVAGRSGAVHHSAIDDRTYTAKLEQIATEATRHWAGPPPHEEQVGVGHRADWRFLLPDGERKQTTVVLNKTDRRFATDAWNWLVDDGWTDAVTVSAAVSDQAPSADVVFVGRDASLTEALGICGPEASVVVEHGRSPTERARQVRTLRAGGFDDVQQFLVTPNLEHAKRYVPLADGLGLQWLLASPPVVAEPAGRTSMKRTTRRRAVDLVAKAAGSAVGPAVASSIGEGLLLATRSQDAPSDGETNRDPVVLITSGHDEGSRVVLAPLAADGVDPGPVVKIASRPRYNGNVDAEVARIHALRQRLTINGLPSEEDMLPEVEQPFDIGPLRASREAYAGRWTASDLCYRMPKTRDVVLDQVIETIDRFTLATTTETVTWSPAIFDRLLGNLFDRYDAELGTDPGRNALRARLRDRADALAGEPLPLGERHYDLGPWNIVFGEGHKPITLIDWELGPPREVGAPGPAGADQLYFIKYWLHIAMDTKSVDDEQTAFDFLAPGGNGGNQRPMIDPAGDPRIRATAVMAGSLDRIGVTPAAMPLLSSHVWLESALHTIERRRANGIEPGSPGRYLQTTARYADRLLDFWPLTD